MADNRQKLQRPAARPDVARAAAYALADLSSAAETQRLLSQNESPEPPSPRALAAARDALDQARLYPDPDWTDLRTAIAETHNLDPTRILCGAGSLELIGCIAGAYLRPGDHVVLPEHGYLFYRTVAALMGADVQLAPEVDLTVDPEAILARVRPETRLVAIANPGNPTGTALSLAHITRLADALPATTLLIVDEAYGEFLPDGAASCLGHLDRPNVAVLRTFSKAYALAGLRVGWGWFPAHIADETRKLLNPNNLSLPSQAAAAAAMRDGDHLRDSVSRIAARRDGFIAKMRKAGRHVPDSLTNFVLLRCQDAEDARQQEAALRAEGVFVRSMGGYGLGDHLRITVGTDDDMEALLQWFTT